jgi:hypothetical protein
MMTGDQLRRHLKKEIFRRVDPLLDDDVQYLLQMDLPLELLEAWRNDEEPIDIVRLGDLLSKLGTHPMEFFMRALNWSLENGPDPDGNTEPITQFVRDMRTYAALGGPSLEMRNRKGPPPFPGTPGMAEAMASLDFGPPVEKPPELEDLFAPEPTPLRLVKNLPDDDASDDPEGETP